ncbi:MAG: hypothetical protein ACE5D0_07760 [Fidelibacterota bacterium]
MILNHDSALPVLLESAPSLAAYLGVKKVTLVREDLLDGVGGKKRRSLNNIVNEIPLGKNIHILSYQGSHTALTLSDLLPDHSIILYGKSYPGGGYRDFMTQLLSERPNVSQFTGSLLPLLIKYIMAKFQYPHDWFMNFGGAVGHDEMYISAAEKAYQKIGNSAHHIVPVASGDLLKALKTIFSQVTGILTQPWYIRIVQRFRLPSSRGMVGRSYSERESLVRDIYLKTGFAFDPVFMGSVLEYCMRKTPHFEHICLWVTCPGTVSDFLLSFDDHNG